MQHNNSNKITKYMSMSGGQEQIRKWENLRVRKNTHLNICTPEHQQKNSMYTNRINYPKLFFKKSWWMYF